MANGISIPVPQVTTLGQALGGGMQQAQNLATTLQNLRTAQAKIPLMQAQLPLLQAQTKLAQQRAAQLAEGIPGRFAPGGAGLEQGIQMLIDKYGIDSPQVKRALAWNESNENMRNSRANYFNANLALKNLPEPQRQQLILQIQKDTGKPIAEINNELSGNIPIEGNTTTPGLTPNSNSITNPNSQAAAINNTYFPTDQEKQENQEQVQQTENILAKKVGSAEAQKVMPPLLDITKTINDIDFTPVAKFAGLHGKAYATYERALASLGMQVSPDFQAYDNFVNTQGKLLADATRQALQTSVRNQYVQHMITPLMNTAVWYENPELAMNRFNYFRNWLNDRTKVMQYLATKGISPNAKEMNKSLGIGSPPKDDEAIPAENLKEARSLSTEQLLRIAHGGQ